MALWTYVLALALGVSDNDDAQRISAILCRGFHLHSLDDGAMGLLLSALNGCLNPATSHHS
jgi:hypothetical protein